MQDSAVGVRTAYVLTPRNVPPATHLFFSMTENQPSSPVDPENVPKEGEYQPESSQVSPAHESTAKRSFGTNAGFSPRGKLVSVAAQHFDSSSAAVPKRSFGSNGNKPVAPTSSSPSRAVVDSLPVRRPIDRSFEWTRLFLLAVIMAPLCVWASYPSWGSMVYEWYYSDDYSHGFLVIPATLFFLYMRRDSYPGTSYKLDWVGLFPIFLYGVMRIFAGLRFIEALDAGAIWFWILSVVWFFYGWRVFLWALPSLCFLIFMFQLPWRFDVLMRNQLQYFAAHFAALLLQMVGEAAVPIKNTIRLSTTELGVEAACSGLRFLMSVFAIAFATVLLMRRPWWQNVLILSIAAPLALFVNAVRIAITGILLEHYSTMVATWVGEGQSIGVAADAFAGKIAIVLALGLFALFVWYLGKIFRQVEI